MELGGSGQGPGSGLGGLGAQRAGQEGRATWEGWRQTDTSELTHNRSTQAVFIHAHLLLQHSSAETPKAAPMQTSEVTLRVKVGFREQGTDRRSALAEAQLAQARAT